ncbi:sigma-70 family RNA polymerase sigma factor [Myroides pelagicus]|uniref:Sigma-70 family RNA polymerase sigma factor n=1 Tax=Myroides pelagicus TaxID=270914 RepID=A0A7K1GNJ3_9FLAO|nr:sigma-70 family RNA polymerase sigma factor [Myroides pelagicus]MEC4114247.1 sigma-70 family RNA polymerase sigma factor [Myroides pelagicus]MTH30416.1 sigma-70 family RNA polymerase sigma factor [Myroides pelagicus]
MILNNKSKQTAEQEDCLLFDRITLGDEKALELFYTKYYDYLCRFARSYEKDFYTIEEKISDAFYYLWINREKLTEVKSPKVYVFTMVKNMLLKDTARTRLGLLQINTDEHEYALPEGNIEDKIIGREQEAHTKKYMLNVLSHIPPQSLRVFEMCRIDGMKYKQVAEILGISVKTVESHMYNAMRIIERYLTKNKL